MNLKNINNLIELFFTKYKLENKDEFFLNSLSLSQKNYTWKDTALSVLKLSNYIKKDVNKGDRCLLISENRPEWMIADLAIMLVHGITVPTYTTYTEKDYKYIIEDCEPTLIFVSNIDQFKKIENLISEKKFIKKVIIFDYVEMIEKKNILHIQNILKKEEILNEDKFQTNIKRTDPACIIYTSGTQGKPKGVILSHGGILSNCEGAFNLIKSIISQKPKFLTWLPLSHSYEHTIQFVQIAVGAQIFYAENIEKLIKNMNECNPEIMTAVPRFYQNLYQKINNNFDKATGLKKSLIKNTIKLGKKKLLKKKLSLFEFLINYVCEKLVRKKIKNQFGGRLKAFVSGGGALDKEVGFFLNSIGLPTLQGYGLTETSPVVSCNPINDIRVETVGPPFKGNTVKIAKDGEILIKGENVMLGYWKNKEETKKVLKDDWLHSGDIGEFDNNYLKITDRKKDIIIPPGGENISPVKIENDLLKLNFVEQALVYGDNKPYLIALLVLSDENKNLDLSIIQKEIDILNKEMTKIEKIKKFIISKEKFSIENGMLTPTLKLKRYKIIIDYKNEFEKLY